MKNTPSSPSRRVWLKVASTALAMTTLPAIALGDARVSKSVAHYQDHPHTGKMCGVCQFFIANAAKPSGNGMMGTSGMMSTGGGMMGSAGMMRDGSCKLVAGSIGPMGYCQFYQPVEKP